MAGISSIGKGEAMVWNKRVLAKAVFIGALIGSVSAAALFAATGVEAVWLSFFALLGVPGGAIGGSFGAYMGKTGFANSYAPWIGCVTVAAILGPVGALFLTFIWVSIALRNGLDLEIGV